MSTDTDPTDQEEQRSLVGPLPPATPETAASHATPETATSHATPLMSATTETPVAMATSALTMSCQAARRSRRTAGLCSVTAPTLVRLSGWLRRGHLAAPRKGSR